MTNYPENKQEKTWGQDGVQFYLVRHSAGHYCGYCVFPKRPVKEPDYDGILTYVPVHGGITYASERDDGTMCYGFDCAHSDSPSAPSDEWLKKQCELMAAGIKAAVEVEDDYLLATGDNEKRAKIIDAFHNQLRVEFPELETYNLGIGINLLGGQL